MRGLVSRTALLVEKAGLAAVCSAAACLLMLVGPRAVRGPRLGPLPALGRWRSRPAAVGFAALGLAIGALTREVRAASLLAFMLALPLAFLALVPSGSVAPALYDVSRAISALFPFKPTLDALNAALNDSGDMAGPLAAPGRAGARLRGAGARSGCAASHRRHSDAGP